MIRLLLIASYASLGLSVPLFIAASCSPSCEPPYTNKRMAPRSYTVRAFPVRSGGLVDDAAHPFPSRVRTGFSVWRSRVAFFRMQVHFIVSFGEHEVAVLVHLLPQEVPLVVPCVAESDRLA